MGVGGQRHAPAAFTPGKDPVPIVQEAVWAPGPVWTVRIISHPPGFFWGVNMTFISSNCRYRVFSLVARIINAVKKKNGPVRPREEGVHVHRFSSSGSKQLIDRRWGHCVSRLFTNFCHALRAVGSSPSPSAMAVGKLELLYCSVFAVQASAPSCLCGYVDCISECTGEVSRLKEWTNEWPVLWLVGRRVPAPAFSHTLCNGFGSHVDPRTFQPVASRSTDWVILAPESLPMISYYLQGSTVCSWLRHCSSCRTVLGSIPGGVTLGNFSVATEGTMCRGVDSASKNEYQGFPLGMKAAGAWGWRPTTLVVPNVKKIRGLNLPGTPLGPCGLYLYQQSVVGSLIDIIYV
jgi:hypothetical protein